MKLLRALSTKHWACHRRRCLALLAAVLIGAVGSAAVVIHVPGLVICLCC